MIHTKKYIKGFTINEYWFAKDICKSDIYRIATYRNYQGIKQSSMFMQISYTLETDLTQGEEQIFKSFESNCRNEIHKTEKMKFDWKINKISIDDFIRFYNCFAKSKGLKAYAKRRLTCYKPENISLISASYGEELLIVHVCLVDGKRARLLHSVSQIHDLADKEKRKQIGYFNRRLHWEEMKYFKSLGYDIYDWGGFSHKFNDKTLMGINAFKKSFGGIEHEVVNYNSFLQEIIEIILKLKSKI
jgi:lipid II:glycine glycyltransferase (peptidoglycan interpeptide bridge formation enzyme)